MVLSTHLIDTDTRLIDMEGPYQLVLLTRMIRVSSSYLHGGIRGNKITRMGRPLVGGSWVRLLFDEIIPAF